jgi:hypothetical protein
VTDHETPVEHVDVHVHNQPRNKLAMYTALIGLAVLLACGATVAWVVHIQADSQTTLKHQQHTFKVEQAALENRLKAREKLNDQKWCALINFSLRQPKRLQPGETQKEFDKGHALVVKLGQDSGCPKP